MNGPVQLVSYLGYENADYEDPFYSGPSGIKGECEPSSFIHARITWTKDVYYSIAPDGAPDRPVEEWDPQQDERIVVREIMTCWGRGLSLKRGARHA